MRSLIIVAGMLFSSLIAGPAIASDGLSSDSRSPYSSYDYEDDASEKEMQRLRKTDPEVKRIFQVTENGIFWFEAETADGSRYVIEVVTTGTYKGYTDFGDGAGGRYVEFRL